MEKSIKSIATNYGLYLGLTLALITVILYAVKLELLVNFWIIFLLLPLLVVAFGVVSVAKSKGILEGFISFKEAFTSYFITVALGVFISTIVTFIIFNFVDPEAAATLKELAIEKTVNMMEGFGAPAEQIAQQVDAIEKQDTQSITSQVLQFAQSLIFYVVIGLIVSLIMRRSEKFGS